MNGEIDMSKPVKDQIVDFCNECLDKWWNKLGHGESWDHYRWLLNMIANAHRIKRYLTGEI